MRYLHQVIIYYHGKTHAFLDQPQGEPTRDLMTLVREGLRGAVRVALHRCAAERRPVTVLDGWVEVSPRRQARVPAAPNRRACSSRARALRRARSTRACRRPRSRAP